MQSKMWFSKLVPTILVLCFLNFSNGHNNNNITNNFEKIALPKRFIDTVQNFINNNENKISKQCKFDLLKYIHGLFKTPKPWAWLMFDAGSKIPSGILSGNVVDLGQFDQCLKIDGSVSGKYCLGTIPLVLPETLTPLNKNFRFFGAPETRMIDASGNVAASFATCLPNSCTTSEIQSLYSWIGIKIEFIDELCQSKSTKPELTGPDIATITFLSLIIFIMMASTIYDIILFYWNKKPQHSLLIAFSVLSNGRKLLTINKNARQISCLHGIRVISMMWVILGHRYSLTSFLPKINNIDTLRWMYDEKNMFVMGATVSVDTFFLVGGLVVSYTFMNAMAKKGQKFNIFMYYLHRYLRLTPILAVIILIYVTILKHLGSGPIWNMLISATTKGCEEYWWSALLYVQNYVNSHNLCVGQAWYLSVDTQLFILSPIILIPLKKKPKIGLLITLLLFFGSIIAAFLETWFRDMYGFALANQGDKLATYHNHFYHPTHTRAGPWLIGIILGYYIYEIKQNHKRITINKITAVLLWITSLTILCACVYTGHNTLKLNYVYDRTANAFYMALLRPGWAIALSWVIIACVIGYGGPVNWFLSLPIFEVVSKFTYSMYLIHAAILALISGQMRTSLHFSNLVLMYSFWGDFVFSFATALFFTLAFESPIIIIEKSIFGTEKKKLTRSMASIADNEKKLDIP